MKINLLVCILGLSCILLRHWCGEFETNVLSVSCGCYGFLFARIFNRQF